MSESPDPLGDPDSSNHVTSDHAWGLRLSQWAPGVWITGTLIPARKGCVRVEAGRRRHVPAIRGRWLWPAPCPTRIRSRIRSSVWLRQIPAVEMGCIRVAWQSTVVWSTPRGHAGRDDSVSPPTVCGLHLLALRMQTAGRPQR